MSVTLPVTAHTSPAVTESGTLVIADAPEEGIAVEVQAIEGGSARLITIAEEHYSTTATHEYDYEFTLPEGAWLAPQPDGTVNVLQDASTALADAEDIDPSILDEILPEPLADGTPDTDPGSEAHATELDDATSRDGPVVLASFAAPWSVDSNGNSLPTHYEVDGNTITQVVDTTGAAFPVVSDPWPLVGILLGAAARALAPHAVRAFAAQTIRAGATATVRGGYTSFARFKAAFGTKPGTQWHHIVEQSAGIRRGWDPRVIHHPNNLVQIPTAVHQKCINSWMARTGVRAFGVQAARGQTMRHWVQSQTYSKQHAIGVALLRHCGVQI